MNTTVRPADTDLEPGWRQSLGTGAPGITLLHIELARCGLGSWATVQQWATAATRNEITVHPTASLYNGAPAVAFALHAAGQPAYWPVLDRLDHDVREIAKHRLTAAHERIDRNQFPALAEYDLISGLTSIGTYLLYRNQDHETLREVLAYLVRLAAPLALLHGTFPGWWTANGPQDIPVTGWEGGHANFGMAHGIAGPLALLSTAMRRGVTVAGHGQAVEHIATWLDRWQCGSPSAPWWPEMISLAEMRTGRSAPGHAGRPSWCYGTPGIARAQQLAGLALADRHRQHLAEDSMAACIEDEVQLRHVTDASLCHGWAGLIQSVWRIAAESDNPRQLHDSLTHLRSRLDRYLGDHDPKGAGLLEGAAGIDLTIHTTGRTEFPPSRWDACLLLDG